MKGDNLNNARCNSSKHFRNKWRKYLKDKINELAIISKNKKDRDLCRGINELKKSYQNRNNFVKNKNGDLPAESYNSLTRWKSYYLQLLNVNNFSDGRQRSTYI
jgi:hypothetical protein